MIHNAVLVKDKLEKLLESVNSAIESTDSGELDGWELSLIQRRLDIVKQTVRT